MVAVGRNTRPGLVKTLADYTWARRALAPDAGSFKRCNVPAIGAWIADRAARTLEAV